MFKSSLPCRLVSCGVGSCLKLHALLLFGGQGLKRSLQELAFLVAQRTRMSQHELEQVV